ncbi:MAG: hypothetical protein Q4B26_09800 [Eubacteriales bacterium]|nr:hypothetical protein [Eubacteriales bacterium]
MSKAAKIIVITLSILIVAGLAGGGLYVYSRLNSPEYALLQTQKDVQENGISGLSSHVTEDLKPMVETAASVADSSIVSGLVGLLSSAADDNGLSKLQEHLSEISWELGDVLKSKNSADVHLVFKYKEEFQGDINISMVRQNGTWLINGIGTPSFF